MYLCIISCMKIEYSSVQLSAKIKAKRITQKQIEIATGVSQSQISRLLSSERFNNSKSYKKICNYVFLNNEKTTRELVLNNEDLINALSTVWDGSDDQAKLIADVIYSLGGLCLRPQMK